MSSPAHEDVASEPVDQGALHVELEAYVAQQAPPHRA
jgi:hypothetical protein